MLAGLLDCSCGTSLREVFTAALTWLGHSEAALAANTSKRKCSAPTTLHNLVATTWGTDHDRPDTPHTDRQNLETLYLRGYTSPSEKLFRWHKSAALHLPLLPHSTFPCSSYLLRRLLFSFSSFCVHVHVRIHFQ
jgi:hypothetical protein